MLSQSVLRPCLSSEESGCNGSTSSACGSSSRPCWAGGSGADYDDARPVTTDLERLSYVIGVALIAFIAVVIVLWKR